MAEVSIVDITADNIEQYGMCGYKNLKNEGYRKKVEWVKQRFAEGMRYKTLVSETGEAVGSIEYIPGEYAWRGIAAPGYLVIHCIAIFPKGYKGIGCGQQLLAECMKDAESTGMNGVAAVTRQGSWMAGRELFAKNGFRSVDQRPPDFDLMVWVCSQSTPLPVFKENPEAENEKGLTIFYSEQCPYASKTLLDVTAIAKDQFGMQPRVIHLMSAQEAQAVPCVNGSFCMTFDGKVIADHPISGTRFKNIMTKRI